MARTFTTLFPHNGKTYTAVISRIDGAVNIYVPDESLHHLLPGGKAVYRPAQGLPIDTPRLNPTQHLLLKILTSMEEPAGNDVKTQTEAKK